MPIYEHADVQYLAIIKEILEHGSTRMDRTGTGTKALFGRPMRFHMDDGFPAVTTKRLAFRSVVGELLWMLSGDNDNNHLRALGVHIWDGNAYAPYWTPKAKFDGDTGRNYSIQWRHWLRPDGQEVDQVSEVIERIKAKPADRRLIFTGWNSGEVEETSLPACHAFTQFFVRDGELSLNMYQRSCDMFLGVPFNMAQYGLILHLFAQLTGLRPGEVFQILGDAHIYLDHLEQAALQATREPYPQPTLWLNPDLRSLKDVEDKYHDLLGRAGPDNKPKPLPILDEVAKLMNYQHHPEIKAKMSA